MPASVLCGLAIFLGASSAWADKIAVLSFAPLSTQNPPAKPELDEARKWTREGIALRGHSLANDSEMRAAESVVRDGTADTSEEYRAAGIASASQWTLTGRLERIERPSSSPDARTPADAPSPSNEAREPMEPLYRLELEACQVESGRVESLARDLDPASEQQASDQVAEMLALLLRPEGIGEADVPWKSGAARKSKPKPAPPARPAVMPSPPTPAPLPSFEEPENPVEHDYGEGHPFAIGASIGMTSAFVKPTDSRGSSLGMPVGGVLAYALDSAPGLELRGVFTSQVAGPEALEISAGARYAVPVLAHRRVFVGPELLGGVLVAFGADKTTRALTHGSAFVAVGIGEHAQIEVAGDLMAAVGGSGTLFLGGGTARALVRF